MDNTNHLLTSLVKKLQHGESAGGIEENPMAAIQTFFNAHVNVNKTKMRYEPQHEYAHEEYEEYEGASDDEVEDDRDANEFRNLVKQLLAVEDDIDTLTAKLKPLREKKAMYRREIISYMKSNDIEHLNLNKEGSFKLIESKRKINPFTQKRLKENLSEYFYSVEKKSRTDAEKKTDMIFKYISDHAERIQSQSLRRKKN